MSLQRVSELLGGDDKKDQQCSKLVLCRKEPHQICGVNAAFTAYTGWEGDEVAHRSLDVMSGPSTNLGVLRGVVRSAAEGGDESECCVVLYNKSSESQVHMVKFERCLPQQGEEDLILCFISAPQEVQAIEKVVEGLPFCKESRIIAHSNHPFLVTNVSQTWLEMFGSKMEEVRGGSLKTLDGTGTNGHLLLDLMKSVKRGLARQLTLPSYKKDGTPIVIYLKCTPLLGKTGDLDHFIADATCVPAMMLSKAMSSESESYMVVALDKKSTVSLASQMLCDMIGWHRPKFEGRTVTCIFGPKTKVADVYDRFEAAQKGQPMEPCNIKVYKADGTSVICVVSAAPLLNDDNLRVTHIHVCMEPSDVLTYEEAVAQQDVHTEAKFIAMATPPFTIKQVNDAWCQLYSIEREHAVGRSLRIIQGPGTSSSVLSDLKANVLLGTKYTTPITTYNTCGIVLQTNVRVVPILSDSGEIDTFQGVILDCNVGPTRSRYPITPTGHITHINGYTQLVLYPKADPTLEHCIDYLCHLKEAHIVKSWAWHGEALKVNVDTQRVLEHTKGSAWCQKWTADLRTWHAWWNRMLWVVSEASKKQHEEEEEMASDFSFLGESSDRDSGEDKASEESVYKLEEREGSASSGDDSKGKDSGKSSGQSGSGGTYSTSTLLFGSNEVLIRLGRELSCMGLDDAACLIDAKGRVIFANEAFLRSNGYEEPEMEELAWTALFCPGTDTDVVAEFEAFLGEQGGRFEANMLLRRKDGSSYWGSIVAEGMAFQNEGYVVPCFCVSVEDASGLADAEEEDELELDPFAQAMLEELQMLQARTLRLFKLGLAHVETTVSTDGSSSEEDEKDKGPFTELLIRVPEGAKREHCVKTLNALKKRDVVQSFVWEGSDLRVFANVDALYRCVEYIEPVKDSWPVATGFKQWLTTMLMTADEAQDSKEQPEQWADLASVPQGAATDLAFLGGSEEAHGDHDEGSVSVGSEECSEDFHVKEELLQLEVRVLMKELDRLQLAADHQRAAAVDDETKNNRTIAKLQSELEVCRKLIEFQHRELAAAETDKFVSESAIRAMKGSIDSKTGQLTQLRAKMGTDSNVMKMALETITRFAESSSAEAEQLAEENKGLKAENEALRALMLSSAWLHPLGTGSKQSGSSIDMQAGTSSASSSEPARGDSADSRSEERVAGLPADLVHAFRRSVAAEGVRTGLCLCGEGEAIAWSNAAFSRVTGYGPAEVCGEQWFSFLCGPETDAGEVAAMREQVRGEGGDTKCLRCYHSSGRIVWLQVLMQGAALPGGERCVLMAVDDVSRIVERLLAGGMDEDDTTAAAAKRVADVQHHAIDVSRLALKRLESAPQPVQLKLEAPPQHISPSPGEVFDLVGVVPSSGWARTRPPEVLVEETDGDDFHDVVLYPNGDTHELLKTGLLWQLKHAQLVDSWSWSWEHDGALKVRLRMGLVLARSERILSPMFAADLSGWRLWWSRLLCALSYHHHKAKAACESPKNVSNTPSQGSASNASSSSCERGLVLAGQQGAVMALAEAQAETEEARAICSAREPWLILEANPAWLRLTAFAESEVKGRSLAMMQGAVDWPVLVNAMHALVRAKGEGPAARSIAVQSYRRGGEPFQNRMTLVPIAAEGELTHVLATFREVGEAA